MHRFKLVLLLSLFISCTKPSIDALDNSVDAKISLSDMIFLNDTLGYAIGGERYKKFAMFQTSDGGKSWKAISPGGIYNSKYLYDIDFRNGILYMCGEDGKILHSLDSGNTWQEFQNSNWANIYAIYYPEPSRGFIAAAFDNAGIISILNSYGDNVKETTFGNTLNSIHPIDSMHLVAGGSGYIIYSTDAGNSWQASDADGDVFIDIKQKGMDLFAIGYYGKIYKSSDKGKKWKKVNKLMHKGSRAKLRKSIVLQDGRQVVVGEKGLVFISSDGWNSYTTRQLSHSDKNIHNICQSPTGMILLMGTHGMILSDVNL